MNKEAVQQKDHFKVISKRKLSELNEGDIVSTSDYATLTPDGYFVQLEFVEAQEDKKREPVYVKPGIFAMKKTQMGLILQETSFVTDRILEDFVETDFIETQVDKFFQKISVYKELEITNIKRSMLVTGRAGTGKTTMINKTATKYGNDGKTFVLIWHTDSFEADTVKNFIQCFDYERHKVERMIMVVEDLGGGTAEGVRVRSDSSLLSLLDNKEKTFSMPVFILATTNNPEMFQENLVDRPERFDIVVEAKHPTPQARSALLRFFNKGSEPEVDALKMLESTDCKEFSPAHIREIVIRSRLNDISQVDVIKQMLTHSKKYKKGFAADGNKIGF